MDPSTTTRAAASRAPRRSIWLKTASRRASLSTLKQPLTAEEIAETLRKLNLNPRDILRSGEDEYEEMGLDDPSLTDEQLLNAMAAQPILMERPIIARGGRAVVGRPTEAIDSLLNDD